MRKDKMRIFSILLVFILLLLTTACGAKSDTGDTETQVGVESANETASVNNQVSRPGQEEIPDKSGQDNIVTEPGQDPVDEKDREGATFSDENTYVGQKREVVFSIPDGWEQRELSKKYEVIEAKFGNKEDSLTYMMYGCSDIFSSDDGLDRSEVNLSVFGIEEMALLSGISDAISEEKIIGESTYYIYLYHSKGLARLTAITVENGFLHMITLYETTDNIQEQHRESMYELIETMTFPQD